MKAANNNLLLHFKKSFSLILQKIVSNLEANPKPMSILIALLTGFFIYYFYYLAEFYLSMDKQYIVGWGCVLFLVVCNRIEYFQKPPLRLFFVLVAIFLNIRYMVWRITETLVYDGTADFIAMSLLFGAEVYAVGLHFLGIFTNIWPLANKVVPLPADTSLYPSVDIFITTYNEPPEMTRITASAAKGIDYPQDLVRIHILDDGGTVDKRSDPDSSAAAWERHYELRRIARDLDVHYITRQQNNNAKAGNLNHALTHTSADLVLILDCDHVPTKDFLKNTVGWFLKDEKLALVQTPHFFINPNPIEKNIDILKDAPDEGELFYRANHLGLDSWNASFFCGSAALMRRKYLMQVGGVSGETITEDCETAIALHQMGYNSVYIPRPMVCGLSPESFDDFIVQRGRWAAGMTQLMILKNPLFAKGLNVYQRLCYFNNSLFWFFGFSRFIFFIAPAAYLLLDLHVYFASVAQVLAFALPHLFASMILMNFFYGKYRWPFLSELYEGVQSIFLIPVVLSVIVNPRKPSFVVTPKGQSFEEASFSGLTFPFFIMCMILLLTVPAAIIKWYSFPLYRDVIAITITWAMYNLVIAMAAFGAFFEKKQIRGHHRIWTKGNLLVFFPRLKKTIEARVEDISLSGVGLSFELPFELEPSEHIQIEYRDSHGERFNLEAKIERIRREDDRYFCGSAFIINNQSDYARTIQLVYGDSQRWVDYWENSPPRAHPIKLFVLFMKMAFLGFRTTIVAFYHFSRHALMSFVKRFKNRRQTTPVPVESS